MFPLSLTGQITVNNSESPGIFHYRILTPYTYHITSHLYIEKRSVTAEFTHAVLMQFLAQKPEGDSKEMGKMKYKMDSHMATFEEEMFGSINQFHFFE